MNEYDSQKMADILKLSHDLSITDNWQHADLLLLNTCSVREKAQEKVFSELGRWRLLKEQQPHKIIGVGGCVASQEGEAILKRAPHVDIIFGPQTLHRLPHLLNRVLKNKKTAIDVSFPEIEKFDYLPAAKVTGPSANITIMEGCSKYCSFCIVPYTRGEETSRPFDDVLAEIVHLSQQGIKEITLLGQNVNDYRGLMHDGSYADLALLIHHVAAIEPIKRIRFMTSHPNALSNSLIQIFSEPKLANHLHLPVQSGSDRILSAMKRNYTVLEYKAKIKKLRKIRPDIAISSDFIVGFPGETETDFKMTMDLIGEIGFDHSFSFIYSARPGTPAALLPDDVPLIVKKERLAILQNRLKAQGANYSHAMLGSEQLILISHASNQQGGFLYGRTENSRTVTIQGPEHLVGELIPVKIIKTYPHTLVGEWMH